MSLRLPSWLQAGSHPAEDDRLAQGALWTPGGTADLRKRTGVVPGVSGAQLAVAAQGTPDMSVAVEPGQAVIQGTNSILQGAYTVTNDAAVTVNIPASDPTNPRIDIICITVEDAYYSGANNDGLLQVVSGTPAASPTAPATPDNSIVLAEIAVGAAAASIVSGNITDKRVWTVPNGGVLPVLSSLRPSNPYAGQTIFETDTGLVRTWNGTTWYPTSGPDSASASAWSSDSGTWTQTGTAWAYGTSLTGTATPTVQISATVPASGRFLVIVGAAVNVTSGSGSGRVGARFNGAGYSNQDPSDQDTIQINSAVAGVVQGERVVYATGTPGGALTVTMVYAHGVANTGTLNVDDRKLTFIPLP